MPNQGPDNLLEELEPNVTIRSPSISSYRRLFHGYAATGFHQATPATEARMRDPVRTVRQRNGSLLR